MHVLVLSNTTLIFTIHVRMEKKHMLMCSWFLSKIIYIKRSLLAISDESEVLLESRLIRLDDSLKS